MVCYSDSHLRRPSDDESTEVIAAYCAVDSWTSQGGASGLVNWPESLTDKVNVSPVRVTQPFSGQSERQTCIQAAPGQDLCTFTAHKLQVSPPTRGDSWYAVTRESCACDLERMGMCEAHACDA